MTRRNTLAEFCCLLYVISTKRSRGALSSSCVADIPRLLDLAFDSWTCFSLPRNTAAAHRTQARHRLTRIRANLKPAVHTLRVERVAAGQPAHEVTVVQVQETDRARVTAPAAAPRQRWREGPPLLARAAPA